MSDTLNEIAVGGVDFIAVDEQGDTCEGCAFDMGDSSCNTAIFQSPCGGLLRSDKRNIVWIKKENQTETLSENKGVKSDQGKTQWSYLPVPAVKAVVDVMAYGDTKYPAPDGSNWKRVPDAKKRYYNAAMRHLTSWWDGEQNDPETGYNHLAHACSNLLFLLWFEIKGYPETKE